MGKIKTERRGGRTRELSYQDDRKIEISPKTISITLKLIRRYGLDFHKIGKRLYIGEDRAHSLVCSIEEFNHRLVRRAVQRFTSTIRGEKLMKQKKEVMPLEFYLSMF